MSVDTNERVDRVNTSVSVEIVLTVESTVTLELL